jgi:hypothetical protein
MDSATKGGRLGGEERMNGSKPTKVYMHAPCQETVLSNRVLWLQLSASEPIELSRIYPTPPSVENNEGEKFEEVKMTRMDGSDNSVSGLMMMLDNVCRGLGEGGGAG